MQTAVKRIPLALAGAALTLSAAGPAQAAKGVDSSPFRAALNVDNIRFHQQALQAVADANGGTRASGTPGYEDSVEYVVNQLTLAGYQVTVQPFEFPFFQELAPPVMEQTAPDPTLYQADVDFFTMTFSGSGDVTAQAVPADNFGCDPADFANAVFTGQVALILRGECTFAQKAINAQAAGAAAVIVYNDEARQDPFRGTLGGLVVDTPVVGTSFAIGQDLGDADITVRLAVSALSENRTAKNVIAETAGGRDDRVVVVGAHLDSVEEGPGIQDNGSGSAAILEIALELARSGIEPVNKVRFAWWGAEEFGLLGSQYYVDNLSKRDIKNIAVNLNFDMIGSPNFVRFVYDGDGSATATAGPNGSANVERVFLDYFAGQGLPTEPTAFDGRSDYGPFIAVGIPAGGLFTGAEGIKTPEQAAVYGGSAGDQYDPCYHLACDTFDNISLQALDEMSDAAAHAVLTFAMTSSAVNGTAKASKVATEALEFRGDRLQK